MWDYWDIPGGGYKKIKGPAHMDEGGHHLTKAPNAHPLSLMRDDLIIKTTLWDDPLREVSLYYGTSGALCNETRGQGPTLKSFYLKAFSRKHKLSAKAFS